MRLCEPHSTKQFNDYVKGGVGMQLFVICQLMFTRF